MNFGTFLLMQSPSARSSQEIYARAVEMGPGRGGPELQQHLAGRTPRAVPLASAALPPTWRTDHPHPGGHRGHRGAAPPPAGGSRGDRHPLAPRPGPVRHRARPRLPALRVRALRARARERARAVGGVGGRDPEGARGRTVQLRGQALPDPRDHYLPADARAAAAHLDHRAEPRLGRGRGAPRLQRPHRRLRVPVERMAGSASSSTGWCPR